MFLKKLLLGAAVLGAIATVGIATSASAATVVNVGTLPPANPFFYLTNGTPTSPSITANFGATIFGASTVFDDIFQFTIPQNGVGSGSFSTSFSAPTNQLSVTDLLINGMSYALTMSPNGQGFSVAGIPILNGVLNTIEVKGVTSALDIAATYTGTATFAAAAPGPTGAIPEPASWAMMIGGLGLVGTAMRRRRTSLQPV